MIQLRAPFRGETPLEDLRLPARYLPPFSEEARQFLKDWSRALVSSAELRGRPEIAALAHWMGPGRIQSLAESYRARVPCEVMLRARGQAFHVAPSNVDTIFVYSWVLSLLAGNSNYLRLSASESPVLQMLLDSLCHTLAKPEHARIAERTRIFHYDRENVEASRALSLWADVRLIWGGDATVATFRSIPTSPTCLDIAFADKTSLAVLKASAVLELGDTELQALARRFFLDAYTFDQMACSSPRAVYWVGEGSSSRFWAAVEAALANHPEPTAVANQKMLEAACRAAGPEPASVTHWGKASVVRVPRRPPVSCGGGLFWEVLLDDLGQLWKHLGTNEQTVTHFGWSAEELRAWLASGEGRGPDRLVPIGQALSFQPVWDGFELLDVLTRKVTVT